MIVYVLCGLLCKNLQILTETYKKKAQLLGRRSSWEGAPAGEAQQLGRRSSWESAAAGKAQQLGKRSSWGDAVAGEAQ